MELLKKQSYDYNSYVYYNLIKFSQVVGRGDFL